MQWTGRLPQTAGQRGLWLLANNNNTIHVPRKSAWTVVVRSNWTHGSLPTGSVGQQPGGVQEPRKAAYLGPANLVTTIPGWTQRFRPDESTVPSES